MAVLNAAREAGRPVALPSQISEKPGAGLEGIVDGVRIKITGRSKVQGMPLPEPTIGLECIVLFDERLAAVLRFRDTPRAESRSFIAHLKPRHGARRVVLLSGDREQEVRHLADEVGISEVHFSKSPEEKVAIVARATEREKTLFVGDGINDAPAMRMATVGVALGSNSDITSEAGTLSCWIPLFKRPMS